MKTKSKKDIKLPQDFFELSHYMNSELDKSICPHQIINIKDIFYEEIKERNKNNDLVFNKEEDLAYKFRLETYLSWNSENFSNSDEKYNYSLTKFLNKKLIKLITISGFMSTSEQVGEIIKNFLMVSFMMFIIIF